MTLLLRRIASLCIELPGTVYVSAFLCSFAPPFSSPPLWVSSRGWHFSRVLFPFLPWHRLLKPFSFLLSPVIYPHHGAPETKVQFSPQDRL